MGGSGGVRGPCAISGRGGGCLCRVGGTLTDLLYTLSENFHFVVSENLRFSELCKIIPNLLGMLLRELGQFRKCLDGFKPVFST